jgi:hypothetical protein
MPTSAGNIHLFSHPILLSLSVNLNFPPLLRALSLKFPLSLLVVLGCVDTMLVMVDKVEPRNRAKEQSRVSALSGSNTLKMRA